MLTEEYILKEAQDIENCAYKGGSGSLGHIAITRAILLLAVVLIYLFRKEKKQDG